MPLLAIVTLLPVQPHDYWWYVRLGKDVIENRAVPVLDTYSSIQAGKPIVYQSWLSAMVLWQAYKTGGIPLTIFLTTLLIGVTYALLWLALRKNGAGTRMATALTLLAGLSGSNNWTVRPQIFAYPLYVATLWLLLSWHKREYKFIWLLVPIGWMWTNLHGSFILFFTLAGIALIFGNGDRKRLFWIILVSLTMTLLNPRGFVLWRSVIDTFTSPGIRDLSPEWLPPLNQGWQMNIFFAWLIVLVPFAALARQRLSSFEAILFLAFSWLALTGIRYVIWELFIIAIVTARFTPDGITQRFDQTPEIKLPALNYLLGSLFMLMPLMLLPGLRDGWWKDSPSAVDPSTPIAAADWLNQHPHLPGPMWNDVVFGSYLIQAVPSRPVWIDTRIQVIYTAEQAADYLYIQSAQDGWEIKLDEEGVNLLFLAKTQMALVKAVENSVQWCEQYRDETAVIYSRCEVK